MNLVRLTNIRFGLVATTAMAVCGCSGEAPGAPSSAGDAPETKTSSTSEALNGCDQSERDQRNRGPLTTRVGATGHVEIEDFFIGGVFFANDTIIRAKAHPECVLHIEIAEPQFLSAGTLTVSSDFVGTPGGPPAPFTINPDASQQYAEFPDPPLFNFPDGAKVEVMLDGSVGFPPIARTTLRSSIFGTINMTAPRIPDSGLLEVSSTVPLKFKWEVPETPRNAAHARHPQSVSLRFLALGPDHWGQLWCSWPVSEGGGNVPAVLLGELRRQLGGTAAADAALDVYSGEFKEIATATSSYVVFATTDNATTIPRSTVATLQ
jgi:hypothetical protein